MLLSVLKCQSPSILIYVAHSQPLLFLKRKEKKRKTYKNKRTKRMLGDGHLRMLSSISWKIVILYLFEKGIAIPLYTRKIIIHKNGGATILKNSYSVLVYL